MRSKMILTPDLETNPDPENGPFFRVSYGVPVHPKVKAARERAARQREYEMAEINSDPVTKYLYERDQAQEFAARRLARQRGWDTKSWDQILRHVRANWNNSAEPTILNGRNQEEGYTKRITLRQHLKSVRRTEPARLNKVERAAESGDYQVRMFDPIFVEQVKQLRNEKGLTQHDLAVALNWQTNEIAQLERGELSFNGRLKGLLHSKLGF
jgi:DNA-binding XRE family transcriptional regulator